MSSGWPLAPKSARDYEPGAGEQAVSTAGTVAATHEFAAAVLLLWTVVVTLSGLLVWRRRDLL